MYNDPYVFDTKKKCWIKITSPMILSSKSEEYEYWRCAVKPKHRRLSYGFKLIDNEDREINIVENGYYINTSIASLYNRIFIYIVQWKIIFITHFYIEKKHFIIPNGLIQQSGIKSSQKGLLMEVSIYYIKKF